ncbi:MULTISPECIES: hypothetical protein [unclassified Mesorhizobium]|uniref:hypothetical protein n=1 Tax=unclassified Mesorhizobium TaxID=325217 RepID=UPI0003CF46DC|nr:MULTISPECIES: hypothetical protein [unclassified Mesorhizobium]ESY18279.1 hypothetical protein X751_17340 [Mesorhizobium sp. LNJC395A00]WJI73787.1 hypothetical protein NLY37_22640 [Mesorhizobium sp. C395A]
MNEFKDWASAIGMETDDKGLPSLGTVIGHIRGAVVETGFVSRGRITNGLKEAYRPFAIDETALRSVVDEALRILLLSGDVDEFTTGAGRGYATTPPRRVHWGSDQVALLGGAVGADSHASVRRSPASNADEATISSALVDELGRPEWRSALVEIGAADASEEGASALFAFAQTLAASGERCSLDEPQTVAVLGGRGRYFGQGDSAPLSGRWQRVAGDGCFPAVITSGYVRRQVVLSVLGGMATLWEPQSRDLWNWVAVGATLAAGDPALSFDPSTGRLDFLTPPPRQIERAALLTGTQLGSWSWEIDANSYAVIAGLIDPRR